MKNNNRIYRLIRNCVLGLILFVIILSAIFFYRQCRDMLLDKVWEEDIGALNQNKNAAEAMKSIAFSITNGVYNDPNVAWLLYGRDYDPIELSKSLIQLENYRVSMPYIDSIYIYNGVTESITVSSDYNGAYGVPLLEVKDAFFDREIAEIVWDTGHLYARNNPIPRSLTVNRGGMEEELLFYTFLRTNAYSWEPIGSAVFVNFSYDWMKQTTQIAEDGIESIIADGNGRVVSDSAAYRLGTDISGQAFYQSITAADADAEGEFIAEIGGLEYMVSYIPPDDSGWRYIRLVPYWKIVSGLNNIVRLTVLTALALVAVGILLTFVTSRFLYQPIGKVSERVSALEDENRKFNVMSRQHLMRNLLFGVVPRYIPKLNIPVDSESFYRVILMKIDGYRRFSEENDLAGQNLLRYSIMNIAEEINSAEFPTEAVDTGGENGLVMILRTEPEHNWLRCHWEQHLASIADAVYKYLNINLSFVIGAVCKGSVNLAPAYRRVRNAAFHRIFYGGRAVIIEEEIWRDNYREYTYPIARENAMKEAVTAGRGEKAKEILREILFETADYPYSVINMAVARITLLLSNIIKDMQKCGSPESSEDVNDALLSASALSEDTVGHFNTAIDKLVEIVESRKNTRHEEILDRVNRMIERDYRSSDCGVESIAQEIGMSPAHISRLYKRYTLKSISESITVKRMEYARELLRDNKNISVAAISQKTGFTSSSYFSKAFRKEHGMTPNEYRVRAGNGQP